MAFCSNCGQPIPDGGKFCASCGTPVAAPAAPVAQPEPMPVATPVEIQPEPEPVAPAVEIQPEPEPIPVQAPQYAPGTMIGMDVDDDMESGAEPQPIVGTYVAPGRGVQVQAPVQPRPQVQQQARPVQPQPQVQAQARPVQPQPQVQARPAQQPAMSTKQGKKVWPIILIIGGGVAALAVIIIAAVLLIGKASSSAAGEGTALVDMLDDAAYNKEIENGYDE